MSFLFYKHSMQCSQIEYFFLQNTWSLEKVTMPWYAASAVAKMCGGLSPRFTPWYNVENYKTTWPYSLPFCCFKVDQSCQSLTSSLIVVVWSVHIPG